ncbi:MAG: type II toxin-antitoxin system HipA family toxin [Actinobacteria bacterium]|nr:type II toxin-antitoxin system HipA family toxin [Actinomycetota bacterium]
MSETLVVLLDAAVAGTLTRSTGGRLAFAYDEDYRRRAETTPLSLSLPKQIHEHSGARLEAWLWGLLPDSDAVLRRWARQFHVSASSPFALLSTPVGEDCAGAVQFVAPDRVGELSERPGSVSRLTEEEVAERLRDLHADTTAWLGRAFTGQFSLAGAQAKTALLQRDGRWGIPSGATPTTHILKPAVAGLDDHDLNEHLCLDAARRAGLIAARTRIERFAEETAVVVTRYDRITTGRAIRRVHQEDLCQALGIHPERKYQNEGGPSPAQIARLLRSAMRLTVAEDAVRRFADALAWNWLIAGTDAHAKNYSLLLAGSQARLAPLYDIASALPYGTHERKLRLAMKLAGDYRVDPDRNPWPRTARELGLDPTALTDRVRELAETGPDAFADATAAPEVAALERSLPTRLLDLVADRAQRCRRVLDSTR